MKFHYNNTLTGIMLSLCLYSANAELPEDTFQFTELSNNLHSPQYLWSPLNNRVTIQTSPEDLDLMIVRLDGNTSKDPNGVVCLDLELLSEHFEFLISHKDIESQKYTDYKCTILKDEVGLSLKVNDVLLQYINSNDLDGKYLKIFVQDGETLQILHGESFLAKAMCNKESRLAKIKNILNSGRSVNITHMIPQFKHQKASSRYNKKTPNIKISNINNPTPNTL